MIIILREIFLVIDEGWVPFGEKSVWEIYKQNYILSLSVPYINCRFVGIIIA